MLRPFRPSDAKGLAAIMHQAVHIIGARDCTPEQCKAWSPAPCLPQDDKKRVEDGRTVVVAVAEDDKPVALIEFEADGHIDCFCCHSDFAGKGLGRAPFREAQSRAIAAGVRHLTVEASEAAPRFFLREGFQSTARRAFRRRGVTIHNYKMEKLLAHGISIRDA